MIVFSTLVMIGILFLTGTTMQKLLRQPFSFTHAVMMGFLSLLAVFHVITYPLIRLNAAFTVLFWLYTAIVAAFCLSGMWLLFKTGLRKDCLQRLGDLGSRIHTEPLLLLLTIGIAGVYLFVSLGYSYETSDDSYYLPRALEILAQNRLGISHNLGWTGMTAVSFPESVDASTLEAWKAYWSYLFGLHPTIFSRNTLSLIVHLTSWCALYQAYRSISRHRSTGLASCLFLIFYLLFVLVDNHFNETTAFWTLRYPSQGKSILLSVIYPALICGCAQIVSCGKEPIPWQKWAMLALIFTAGVASTIIGVFWPFLCCFTMGVPYLLIERRKDLHKVFPSLLLACLPIVLYAGISYFTIATEQTRYFKYATPIWEETLRQGLNIERLDMLFLCLLFLFVFGSKTAKLVIGGSVITLFVTFANPLFVGFVSKYLTTGSVYFRLFWMVPIYFLPAYAVAELFGNCSLKSRQISALAAASVLVLVCGFGVYRVGPRGLYHLVNEKVNLNQGCERRTNPYGLPDDCYDIASRLLENTDEDEHVRVMWLSYEECFLRQYSERIELVGACRINQWVYFDQPLEEGTTPPVLLQEDFMQDYREDFEDPAAVHTQLTAIGVDYICVRDSSGFAKRETVPAGFEPFLEEGEIIVYRILPE